MRIHLIPNSHIDPVWLWDKYEGIDEVINTFRSACDCMDEYPDLTFSASSLQFYEWVQQFDPGLFRRIVEKVHEGRWEVAGGWWVEPDTNIPTEASFVKHAEISQDFARRYFGQEITVAYLPDTFGHPALLPKVLARTGFKYMVFCRPNRTEKPDLPANLFEWEYEGHRVLAYRLKHHYMQGGVVDEDNLGTRLNDEEYRSNPVNSFFFGVGDHGGGPSRAEIEFYNKFISARPSGDVGYSTCLRFFEEAEASPDIPVYRGDLHMHAVGCYSVLRGLKNAVRGCEHGLQFAARALDMNGETDACLDPAWKITLFNQFHDILPGSCSPGAADQAQAELGGVENVCRDTSYRALKSVSMTRPPSAEEGEFRIFNTLSSDVTVPLHIESFGYYNPDAAFRDEDGNEISIQEVLPSVRCSNRRWEFVDSLPARGFKSYRFDNEALVKRPDSDAAHFQPADEPDSFLDPPIRFLVLDDESDTWGHGVTSYDNVVGEFALVSSAVQSGPVTEKLYQHLSYQGSTLQVIYSRYDDLPGVYMDVTANWTGQRKILKIEICPPDADSSRFIMQAAGGSVERPADGRELPMHHWVWTPSGKGGLALVQDGSFACDCAAGRLRLTFVRSNLYAFHHPFTLSPADPQRPTDQGEHQMRLHLLPRDDFDAEELNRLADAFLEPYPVIRDCRQV